MNILKLLRRLQAIAETPNVATNREASTQVVNQKKLTANEIVAQIHETFDSASDRLLKEASDIVNGIVIDKKAMRMYELGFREAVGVQENRLKAIELERSMEESRLIMHYQQSYPKYKFITNDEIRNICFKYGLLFGVVNRYKGDIPEKNLREIEAFKKSQINECDMVIMRYSFNNYGGPHRPPINPYDTSFKIAAPIKDMDTTGMEIKDGYILSYPDPVVFFPVRGGCLIVSKWGIEGQDGSLTNEKMN